MNRAEPSITTRQPTTLSRHPPALVSRTLSDLTPDERHVLRSVSLLDAFDIPCQVQVTERHWRTGV
ncbi:hypothetical protein ABT187_46435 [Streptomyces sp. NPDC001817]|uniref:hypothetical protein n=1 Tax=Streptomyces sp. NPDC001817 TaxID=3154398 RepID=UPI00331EC748